MELSAPALSYTQWEAWLSLYHGKVLIIAAPQDGTPHDADYKLDEDQRSAQQAHLERLASVGRYLEIRFSNADELAVEILRSKLQDILAAAGGMTEPGNLSASTAWCRRSPAAASAATPPLSETLRWLDAAFVGDAQDVRAERLSVTTCPLQRHRIPKLFRLHSAVFLGTKYHSLPAEASFPPAR